jgi:ElaB/YqjD/DUF883 family membrane-anchored ribosome-binding protein
LEKIKRAMRYMIVALFFLAACDGPNADAKIEKIENELDTFGQKAEPVLDSMGQKLERAGEKIKDEFDTLKEKAKPVLDSAGEKLERGARRLDKKVKVRVDSN